MNERMKESERNLRMFALLRMNLFLCCEEQIELQHSFKRAVET